MPQCENTNHCLCHKLSCQNHGRCCQCVKKHRTADSLPYCLFPNNDGNKSNQNYYKKLKEKYDPAPNDKQGRDYSTHL